MSGVDRRTGPVRDDSHWRARPVAAVAERQRLLEHAGLWLVLAGITALLALVEGLPIAVYEPRLSVAVHSVCGILGLGLLQLGVLRYLEIRRPVDVHVALAFGVLGVSNLYAAAIPLVVTPQSSVFERGAYFLLLTHTAAAALFLSGLAILPARTNTSTRMSKFGLACGAALAIAAPVVALTPIQALPPLLDTSAYELLATGNPLDYLLPGQQATLVVANLAIAAALLICAVGYTEKGWHERDAHGLALGAALIFMFFGQVDTLIFPLVPIDYLGAGDVSRLVGQALLLSNVMSRTAREFAASAKREERLRLSRELHDGLAQQLASLRLRLSRLAQPMDVADVPLRDLQVAERILESASLEARRSIAALRAQYVRWQDFEQALTAFSAEFSLAHDVETHVRIEPCDLVVDPQLQADVLGVIHEAFANAARHGDAKQIEAIVGLAGDALYLTVHDDGRGFDPAIAPRGVGLQSMIERVSSHGGRLVIDSNPGNGTSVRAWLPLHSYRPQVDETF
jgi:signal transduction histidine kinase